MLFKETLHGFADMVASAILNQEDGSRDLSKKLRQELSVAIAIELFLNSFVNQFSGEKLNQAKQLVAFSFSRSLDLGLFTTRGPNIDTTNRFRISITVGLL